MLYDDSDSLLSEFISEFSYIGIFPILPELSSSYNFLYDWQKCLYLTNFLSREIVELLYNLYINLNATLLDKDNCFVICDYFKLRNL